MSGNHMSPEMMGSSEGFAAVGELADEPLLSGVGHPMVLYVTRTHWTVRTVRPIARFPVIKHN